MTRAELAQRPNLPRLTWLPGGRAACLPAPRAAGECRARPGQPQPRGSRHRARPAQQGDGALPVGSPVT